jgi:hypothetical protein
MSICIRRREFIAALGGAAASWPLAARAQQPPVPTIGYLHAGPPNANFEAAFRKGLSEIGFVDGRNVAIEFRYAGDQNDRLLTTELTAKRLGLLHELLPAAARFHPCLNLLAGVAAQQRALQTHPMDRMNGLGIGTHHRADDLARPSHTFG